MVSKLRTALAGIPAACIIAVCAMASAHAQAPVDSLMSTMRSANAPGSQLSVVRESALRESATVFGAREGLRVQSCAIRAEIEKTSADLDKRFRFGNLMMGRGILPPVISEARNSVALERNVMVVANIGYHLDEDAQIVDVPPTWRDWLYVGLSTDDCARGPVDVPVHDQLKPQGPAEEAFYRSVLARSYEMGTTQARDVLKDNIARLDRTYQGMRRYFELYQRNLVSAPVIATSTDIFNNDDPNTLLLGRTVIRITVQAGFVPRPSEWRPLGE